MLGERIPIRFLVIAVGVLAAGATRLQKGECEGDTFCLMLSSLRADHKKIAA